MLCSGANAGASEHEVPGVWTLEGLPLPSSELCFRVPITPFSLLRIASARSNFTFSPVALRSLEASPPQKPLLKQRGILCLKQQAPKPQKPKNPAVLKSPAKVPQKHVVELSDCRTMFEVALWDFWLRYAKFLTLKNMAPIPTSQ
jgi:hypothetical protein